MTIMRTSSELTDEPAGPAPAVITGWLAVVPLSVRASLLAHETVSVVMRRLPGDPIVEPSSRPGGYREHGGVVRETPSRSLAHLAKRFKEEHGLRFRTRGSRLIPRWLERVRAVLIADDPADAGAELRITGDPGEVALVCVAAVAELGPCALTGGDRSLRVDSTTTTAGIRRELRAPPDEDPDRSLSAQPVTARRSQQAPSSPER